MRQRLDQPGGEPGALRQFSRFQLLAAIDVRELGNQSAIVGGLLEKSASAATDTGGPVTGQMTSYTCSAIRLLIKR